MFFVSFWFSKIYNLYVPAQKDGTTWLIDMSEMWQRALLFAKSSLNRETRELGPCFDLYLSK